MLSGHRIRLMIQGNQMPVIREKRRILGIIPADRQTQQLFKHSRFLINLIDHSAVISGVGACQIFKIIRNIQGAGR